MKLYDTLSGQKVDFAPWDGHTVRMYVCGVTPYDTTHIGHAMTYLTFDVLNRYCQFLGWRVKYVQNVTDIDDDILKRAKRDNERWDTLGDRHTRQLVEDLSALNCLWPNVYPKASEEVDKIIELTTSLMEQGYAYLSHGNVYFRVSKDEDYGALGKYSHDEMIELLRERGGDPNDPRKEGPLDFILWQGQQPGEPAWESPWGPGRPGWHIECSAMAMRYLGPMIDVHGGGSDLIYPHHESEIAQSQHASGVAPFSRVWMHIGMVRYQGEKMSKSLGNLVLARNVLRVHSADALRLYLHSNHYREAWSYRDTGPAEYEGLASLLKEAAHVVAKHDGAGEELDPTGFEARFRAALDDDLDTPTALVALRELAESIVANAAEGHDIRAAQARLRALAAILGVTGVR
ncbi:MAG: cysteine--tRNA ligase [Chloroflexi bacterium]|nr:MAG: cysteine--tRNA ligase [Chloroflexota bacterium]